MAFDRLNALRLYLKESSAEWILITDSHSARYLSGFCSSNVALLCSENRLTLMTDFRYKEVATTLCTGSPWEFVLLEKSLPETVLEITGEEASIDIQSNYMTVDSWLSFLEYMPKATLNPASKSINTLFSPKEEHEITSINAAASCADRAYARFIAELYEGISERAAARRLDDLCKEEGSEGPSFDTIMLFGSNAALPHGVPSDRRLLQEGDMVLTDFGCTVDGFCSDMTRTASWGSLSEKELEIYNVVLKAQERGKELLRPGIKASQVDAAVRRIIDDAGYGEFFGHGTGHGVGLRIHETPALNKKDDTLLEEGMVVTVEPGIYLPDISGVRIEDLMVITADGAESLSNSPRILRNLAERK